MMAMNSITSLLFVVVRFFLVVGLVLVVVASVDCRNAGDLFLARLFKCLLFVFVFNLVVWLIDILSWTPTAVFILSRPLGVDDILALIVVFSYIAHSFFIAFSFKRVAVCVNHMTVPSMVFLFSCSLRLCGFAFICVVGLVLARKTA